MTSGNSKAEKRKADPAECKYRTGDHGKRRQSGNSFDQAHEQNPLCGLTLFNDMSAMMASAGRDE